MPGNENGVLNGSCEANIRSSQVREQVGRSARATRQMIIPAKAKGRQGHVEMSDAGQRYVGLDWVTSQGECWVLGTAGIGSQVSKKSYAKHEVR